MKECDKRKSNISSEPHLMYIFSNNDRHSVLRPSLHFTTLVDTLHFFPFKTSPTALRYTSLHLSTLHFSHLNFTQLHFTTVSFGLTPFKFPTASFHLTSLRLTSLHFSSLHCTLRRFLPHFCILCM
jgi:hypothetical protein